MKIAYKDFRDALRAKIWPPVPGEARNLRDVHNGFFQDAMAEAGKWVECLQIGHTDVWPFCSTYVDCGQTLIEAPPGQIDRIYTIANGEWCDKVRYYHWEHPQIVCFAANVRANFTSPGNAGLPALKAGVRFAEASTDIEEGRARTGAYSIHRNKVHIVPWIQSNEKVVVEWDGKKLIWNDDDMVDTDLWDLEVQLYIQFYVRWRHEDQFGCDKEKRESLKRDAADKLAGAIHSCASRRLVEDEESCRHVDEPCVTSEEIEDDVPEEDDDMIVFANIGDFGDTDNEPAPTQVADLVKGWEPDFIITNGDNIYDPEDSYEDAVGALYGDYVTDQLDTNRFWPAIGNHDHNDPTNGIDDYFDYFTLPNNERYYDFVKGPVHFFVLHSGIQNNNQDTTEEVDGILSTSKQGEWLRVRLALSTAKWKVVIVHDAPYTSGTGNSPGFTYLRWPFGTWGADVVISGDSHGYERQEVGGLPYLINGAGGTDLTSFVGSPAATSLVRYNADYGAIKGTADCDTLKFEFFNTTGELIDTLELEQ